MSSSDPFETGEFQPPTFDCILYTFHEYFLIYLDIFPSKMLRWCLVCVICNSNIFHSFIFKLYILIGHLLKMCSFYFAHISIVNIFSFLRGDELRHFFHSKCLGVSGLCNL